MKIKYTKKKLRFNLIMGLVWLVFLLVNMIFNDFNKWSDYIWIAVPLMYIGMYFYEYFNQYLTIYDGIIKESSPFGKKVYLNEIIEIKKFAGDYILKTTKKELTINTQIIDPNSLSDLNSELEKLNVAFC